MRHAVLLLPGFFGFANLGDLAYFGHVRDVLARAAGRAGVTGTIHVVPTCPTASLRRRAAGVVGALATVAADADAVHLVGHSTGGLDARLALAPGVSLPVAVDVDAATARVRSVIAVATPHFGTPLASLATSVLGQRALALLSLGTIHVLRFGQLPLAVLLRLGAVLARVDGHLGANSLLLDQLFDALLDDFTPERRAALQALIAEVEREQDLLPQLAPESMDVFAAAVHDRPGVRYGCVVALAEPPSLATQVGAGLDPSAQATHLVYQALHRLAGQTRPALLPERTGPQARTLEAAYGALPPLEANDGVVPTWSQVWGEVVAAVRGDHLDVLGHFGASQAEPPHYDWLTTGSGFDRGRFDGLWAAVARRLWGGPASRADEG